MKFLKKDFRLKLTISGYRRLFKIIILIFCKIISKSEDIKLQAIACYSDSLLVYCTTVIYYKSL